MNGTQIASQYDVIGDAYLRDVEHPNSWNNLYERPAMLQLIGMAQIETAIDLGAATGFYSEYLSARGTSVIAVDSSEGMLRRVRSRVGHRVTPVRADLENGLPFVRSDSQDLVIASLVLHYLADWSKLVADVERVLRPGGRLLISTHHPFLDYLNGKRVDYHSTEASEDVWGREDDPYTVRFYSTSMQELTQRLLNGNLSLSRLIEPPLPNGAAGQALGVGERDRWRPGLLMLEITRR